MSYNTAQYLNLNCYIEYYPGGGGGALTYLGNTGMCCFDDPLFQSRFSAP